MYAIINQEYNGGHKMSVGKNIKKYRKVANLSQQNLADKTGLSIGTIQGYEQERYFPKYENLKKLATSLNCKISDLDANYADELLRSMVHSITSVITDWDDYIPKKNLLIKYFDQLNKLGREEAVKRIEELTEVPKYKK